MTDDKQRLTFDCAQVTPSASRGVKPDTTDEVRLKPDTTYVSAWEEIEAGRFMPRRTRGSFPGRELG